MQKMSETKNSVLQNRIHQYQKKLNEDLLIPKVFITNRWTVNSIEIISFYVARPFPLFQIQPLYHTFRNAFIKEGIDPDGKVRTSSAKRKKKRLAILTTYLRKELIVTGLRNPKIPMKSVVVRWKEKGVTLWYYNRYAFLYLLKHFHLESEPKNFMHTLLKNLHYPRYVIREAVIKGREAKMEKMINTIEFNNLRGWKIEL